MATVNASTSDQLRSEIQQAAADTIIVLDGTSDYSVLTLAKIVCDDPQPVPESGYTIEGPDKTILDTRIFQQNTDNPYSPGFVHGWLDQTDPLNPIARYLTLNYTSGGATNGTALLHSTSGNYVFDYLRITGNQSGWNDNGQLYMSLSSFTKLLTSPRSNVNFTLSNSIINIAGQSNFDYNSPFTGGSAFLHSFNNDGTVTLEANSFDESNYLSSFNFLNQFQSITTGSYDIKNNSFFRSIPAAQNTRRRGSRLTNVTARLENNIFQDGAYLDVFGNIDSIKFHEMNNIFQTISGGFGIKGNNDSTYGPLVGTLKLDVDSVVYFNGTGVPLYYDSDVSGSLTLDSEMMGGAIVFESMPLLIYNQASAGSRAGDDISPLGTNINLWVRGDLGDDTITGSTDFDYIDAGGGNDSVDALGGFDTIYGFEGSDSIYGGTGDDFIDGGLDDDVLDGGDDADIILGGDGNDSINGGGGNDVIESSVGIDSIDGGTGNDYIDGGTENDSILGGSDVDTIYGADGNDTIDGQGGNDLIYGEENDDSLAGGAEADTIFGGNGFDFINGGPGGDILDGEDGKDTILGGNNIDSIYGGTGEDLLSGGSDTAADFIDGGQDNDTITGEGGNDTLLGGSGSDSINGGGGLDTITGGLGADTMTGGAGATIVDRYIFASGDGGATRSAVNTSGSSVSSIVFSGAIDIITDFRLINGTGNTTGNDVMDVTNANTQINVSANASAIVTNTNAWLRGAWSSLNSTFTASAIGADVLIMYNGQAGGFNGSANDIANYVVLQGTNGNPLNNWFV